jgi:hypothetical protein
MSPRLVGVSAACGECSPSRSCRFASRERAHGLLASALLVVSAQLRAPVALLPGKEPTASIGYEVEWAPVSIWPM